MSGVVSTAPQAADFTVSQAAVSMARPVAGFAVVTAALGAEGMVVLGAGTAIRASDGIAMDTACAIEAFTAIPITDCGEVTGAIRITIRVTTTTIITIPATTAPITTMATSHRS